MIWGNYLPCSLYSMIVLRDGREELWVRAVKPATWEMREKIPKDLCFTGVFLLICCWVRCLFFLTHYELAWSTVNETVTTSNWGLFFKLEFMWGALTRNGSSPWAGLQTHVLRIVSPVLYPWARELFLHLHLTIKNCIYLLKWKCWSYEWSRQNLVLSLCLPNELGNLVI